MLEGVLIFETMVLVLVSLMLIRARKDLMKLWSGTADLKSSLDKQIWQPDKVHCMSIVEIRDQLTSIMDQLSDD